MQEQNKHLFDNSLRLVKHCPVCHTKYSPSSVSLVFSSAESHLLYFACHSCSSSLLARVMEMPFGVVGSAMLTDLERNEVDKFFSGEKVSIDDVLEVHQMLENKSNKK